MKQNTNQKTSDLEKFTNINLANINDKKAASPDKIIQKNKEIQLEQTRYLNRLLEACLDCV